jgi:hypothetical protein
VERHQVIFRLYHHAITFLLHLCSHDALRRTHGHLHAQPRIIRTLHGTQLYWAGWHLHWPERLLCGDNDESPSAPPLTLEAAAADYKQDSVIHKKLISGSLPDVHLIGRKLFTEYNFPLQVIAVLLLVATVGCVALSKKSSAPKNGDKPDKG